jgi:hypothetical protein
MPGYTVYDPCDHTPIPAPNEQERDALLAQGYLAELPELPELPEEAAGVSAEPDGADDEDLPPGAGKGRVRRSAGDVASGT